MVEAKKYKDKMRRKKSMSNRFSLFNIMKHKDDENKVNQLYPYIQFSIKRLRREFEEDMLRQKLRSISKGIK